MPALLFLCLGSTAFGGPAAHVALMEEEVVRRRNWPTLAHKQVPPVLLTLVGAEAVRNGCIHKIEEVG
ncbi:chromate transporter [Hymenobacter sp. 5317J-9]|uniref:chromate transporter n=1 Tax=Hymenobacter sp. 5317J-9 TaxID=2932250 RepID=UPI0032AF9BBA